MSTTTENYNVKAKIELGSSDIVKGLDAVVRRLKSVQSGVKSTQLGFDGLLTRAIALGAAYFSFQALTRGVLGFAGSVLAANADVEAMTASLSTIYAAVEKVTFNEATKEAGKLFKILEQVAIVSTATAPELMQVFQGIYGPLRNGGLKIKEIVTLTNNAAVAASALGVDFAQASRDISAMARGTAGLDVKTFSLLQSMGLIKETTAQWNALAPDKRAKKLFDVMNKIGGQAAEAYGRTWKGLSSTFMDIMGAFKRAFGTAVFERLKATLTKVNAYLLENRVRIENYLRVLGERVGAVFDGIINNAGRMFHNAVANMDAIRERLSELYARFEAIKPILITAVKFATVMQVAAFAFNTAVPILNLLLAGIGGAVKFFGAIAAAGGLGPLLASIGSTVMAGITAFLGPLLLLGAVVAAIIVGIIHWKDEIAGMLAPLWSTMRSIGSQFGTIFKDLWVALKPLLEFLGGAIVMAVIAAFRILAWVLDNLLLPPLKLAAAIIRWAFEEILHPLIKLLEVPLRALITAFNWLGEVVGSLVDAISAAIDWIWDKIKGAAQEVGNAIAGGGVIGVALASPEVQAAIKAQGKNKAEQDRINAIAMEAVTKQNEIVKATLAAIQTATTNAAANDPLKDNTRPITHVDMRGSKISIKQEFRQADPDRVWVQVREALESEATARTHSGFADSLAR